MAPDYSAPGGSEHAGNPTLAEAHRRTGHAVVGGVPARLGVASMMAEALAERAGASAAMRAAVA